MTNPPLTGNITFVQHFLPPLLSGEYLVEVMQKIRIDRIDFGGASINTNVSQTYSTPSTTFFVRGERFKIKPEEIKSVFPPPNSQGDFSNVLPHIVLTKKVLPWEWTLDGGPQKPNPNGDVRTWLALLAFDVEDPTPPATVRTIADLMNPGSGVVSYPNLALFPGESQDDRVTTIDVPAELFAAIAPSANDLYHLAHSRTVSPLRKASNAENETHNYTAIVANRLPHGKKTTVHLVGLEGMAGYLPGSGGVRAGQKIRLVSLKSWQFTAIEETIDFAAALRQTIDPPNKPATLKFPTTKSSGNGAVDNALNMGYIGINHQTRLGDTTVSWYHGPLVPYAVPTNHTLSEPARNADALIRYNPNTGMFDESYAAAWQLGRLLALQNKEFATTLYRWKHINQTQTINAAVMASAQRSFEEVLSHIANPANFSSELPTLPDNAKEWLGRLALLYGVPFNYLVPDERMLPPESLRFFQLDLYWLDCLLDGAFSIGRSTSSNLASDRQFLSQILQLAREESRQIRSKWLKNLGANPGNTSPGNGTISGFLLHSAVVSAYPGMEVEVYGQNNPESNANPLAVLRFERIAPNILLCLFDGELHQVRLHKPPEGLHFGVDHSGSSFTKILKDISTGEPLALTATLTFRQGNKQVVNIDALANSMKVQLGASTFTSAEFALEMVEGVEEVMFLTQN